MSGPIAMYLGTSSVLSLPYYYNDPVVTESYVRNPSYLPITVPSSSEQKVIGLVHIKSASYQYLSLYALGNYQVDWGDGTAITTHSSGVQANKLYDWNTLSGSSEVSFQGNTYRQAIFTLTPSGSATLTQFNTNVRVPVTVISASAFESPLKEVYINSPNITYFSCQGSQVNQNLLEYVYVGTVSSSATNYANIFSGANRNLKKIEFNGADNTPVTSVASMYNGCFSLISVPTLLNTSNCTDFSYMYYSCYRLKNIPWMNTSKGTNFTNIYANCYLVESLPEIDTSSGSFLTNFYYACNNLKYIPSMDTRAATNVSGMFYSCLLIPTIPRINIGNATTTAQMFQLCKNLKYIPPLDTSKSTNVSNMFNSCYSLAYIPPLNFASASNATRAFSDCNSIKELHLTSTAKATTVDLMFYNCSKLTTISGTDFISASNMGQAFQNCITLENITSSFNTPNCTTFSNMFSGASDKLVNQVTFTDTSKVTTFTQMYTGTRLINCPPLNTSSGSVFTSMFDSCYLLQTVPTLDTSKGTTFTSMFSNCNALQTLPSMSMASGSVAPATMLFNLNSLLDSNIYGGKQTISYANAKLDRDAIVKIFNNLGTAVAQTITITNNLGVPALSAADRLIATRKGWTIIS